MTRSELNSRMSSKEFSQWMAYHQLEPPFERRVCDLLGQLCYMVANALSDKNKSFDLEEFIPEMQREKEMQYDPDRTVDHVKWINQMLGGRDKTEK